MLICALFLGFWAAGAWSTPRGLVKGFPASVFEGNLIFNASSELRLVLGQSSLESRFLRGISGPKIWRENLAIIAWQFPWRFSRVCLRPPFSVFYWISIRSKSLWSKRRIGTLLSSSCSPRTCPPCLSSRLSREPGWERDTWFLAAPPVLQGFRVLIVSMDSQLKMLPNRGFLIASKKWGNFEDQIWGFSPKKFTQCK